MEPPLDPPHPIHQQAADIATDPGVLGLLARHRDRRVRRLIASNPAAPAERLLWLLEEFPDEVMANGAMTLALMANPALVAQAPPGLVARWASSVRVPGWVLAQLAGVTSGVVRRLVAANPSTPVELLERLCLDRDTWVRHTAMEHPALPPALLERLARDPRPEVRGLVAAHPSTPPAALVALSNDEVRDVRNATVRNPALPVDALDEFSRSARPWVREVVASRTASVAVLELLAADDEPSVRRLVAAHPSCPADVLARLANDPDDTVRRRASRP